MKKQLTTLLVLMMFIGEVKALPAVEITKSLVLPTTVNYGQSYQVKYQFTLTSTAARYVKEIGVMPVASSGGTLKETSRTYALTKWYDHG